MLVVFLSLTGIASSNPSATNGADARGLRPLASWFLASPVDHVSPRPRGSFTCSSPQAQQTSSALLIGLFDDMFYRGLTPQS